MQCFAGSNSRFRDLAACCAGGRSEISAKVPVGFGRDSKPVYVNFEFIDGTRGAHVSISGVSGIATKTSFAMFLLHAITTSGVLEGEAHNTKALVFSVKGEDLLFLDYVNSRLTPAQAAKLRDYLLRGGFLYLDDFWGPEERGRFLESMNMVFPDRPIVEIEDKDSIFHTVYDLDDRYQILGQWSFRGRMRYRAEGTVAHWQGIYDDKGHIMVAMTFNSDVGDSWEWADDPGYPEKFSALGIRIGVNYVVYAMTH